MELAKVRREVKKVNWRHTIDLGKGIITPGEIEMSKLDILAMPEDLTGKTVLDIGAWDGYYSFLAEKRGATVTATDDVEWAWGCRGVRTGKAGFDLAKAVLKSDVQEYPSSVYNLSSETLGKFDIVFFLGVIYHLKSPLRGLQVVYDLTQEMAIIETLSVANNSKKPLLTFDRELGKGNYFVPNLACLSKMLLEVGFRDVKPTRQYPRVARNIRVAVHAYR